ncbi:MAG: hypothetical protein ACRDZ8_01365 [Acidimicrobiales bacterium]
MHTHHLTAALASEHRNQLLREAQQYRLAHNSAVNPSGERQRRGHHPWAPRWHLQLLRSAT